MHNLHFIKVEIENGSCEDAISKIETELSTDNQHVDWFQVVGAYNLANPTDYLTVEDSCGFEVLGSEPRYFNQKVIDYLNVNYKHVEELKTELIELINQLNSENITSHLPLRIHLRTKELTACYQVNNIIEQVKYEFDWSERGLTYFDDCGNSPTHLVLVDFHS